LKFKFFPSLSIRLSFYGTTKRLVTCLEKSKSLWSRLHNVPLLLPVFKST
jgi:outer membrane protein TolC